MAGLTTSHAVYSWCSALSAIATVTLQASLPLNNGEDPLGPQDGFIDEGQQPHPHDGGNVHAGQGGDHRRRLEDELGRVVGQRPGGLGAVDLGVPRHDNACDEEQGVNAHHRAEESLDGGRGTRIERADIANAVHG